MRYIAANSLICLLNCYLASAAIAQTVTPDTSASGWVQQKLTGKERLGPKWTDEQRIDNCKVPLDKRGLKPRSSACPHIPMG